MDIKQIHDKLREVKEHFDDANKPYPSELVSLVQVSFTGINNKEKRLD